MSEVPSGVRDTAAKCFPAAHILKSFVKSSSSSNNVTQSMHLQQLNQCAEQGIASPKQIDGPSTLRHSQKEWPRVGVQERVNPATSFTTNSFNNSTATISVNTTPLVKAPVTVPTSETSTANATKLRSEESHLNVQTEPASRNVSSNFMTPTYNVQSQVIDYSKFGYSLCRMLL